MLSKKYGKYSGRPNFIMEVSQKFPTAFTGDLTR
jgi:hypothetical protein